MRFGNRPSGGSLNHQVRDFSQVLAGKLVNHFMKLIVENTFIQLPQKVSRVKRCSTVSHNPTRYVGRVAHYNVTAFALTRRFSRC